MTKEFPVSTALEKIFEDSGLVSYLASGEMGSSKAGNVLKLLEFVRHREKDGVTAFGDLVEYMEELVDVHEVEEMSLTPGRADAVRLMNLHKAKGLEAPVVILCNPFGKHDHRPDKHVVRLKEEGPKGYFLFQKERYFGKDVLSQPVGWEEAEKEEAFYEAAEEERLMYVAATRAKNMLVVSTYETKLARRSWALLDDNLGEVEELAIVEPGALVPKEVVDVAEAEYGAALRSIDGRRERGAEPSYLVESVTSLVKGEEEPPGWSRAGMGMSWGRAVHHVLEVAGRDGGVNLELLAQNALAAEDRDPGEKWRLVDLVRAVQESDLWQRMKGSEQKFFEIPFSLKLDPADPGKGRSLFGDPGIDDGLFRELVSRIDRDEASWPGKMGKTANLFKADRDDKMRLMDQRKSGLNQRVFLGQKTDMGGEESSSNHFKIETDASRKKIESGERAAGRAKISHADKGKAFGGEKDIKIPVIFSGVIDLVFWEEDGWVMADYKTDEIGSGQSLKPFIDYYAPQVKIYARFWERLSGRKVKETGLFFTSLTTYTQI